MPLRAAAALIAIVWILTASATQAAGVGALSIPRETAIVHTQLPWEKEEHKPQPKPKTKKNPEKQSEKPADSTAKAPQGKSREGQGEKSRAQRPVETGNIQRAIPKADKPDDPRGTTITYRGTTVATRVDETSRLHVTVNGAKAVSLEGIKAVERPVILPSTAHLLVLIQTTSAEGGCKSTTVLSVKVADGHTEAKPGVGGCDAKSMTYTWSSGPWRFGAALLFHDDRPQAAVAVIRQGVLTISEQAARPCLFASDVNVTCLLDYVAAAYGSVEQGLPSGEGIGGAHILTTFQRAGAGKGSIALDGAVLRTLDGVQRVQFEDAAGAGAGGDGLFSVWVQPAGTACGYRIFVHARSPEEDHHVLDQVASCSPHAASFTQLGPDGQMRRWARVMWKDRDAPVHMAVWENGTLSVKERQFHSCLIFQKPDPSCLEAVLNGTPSPVARIEPARPAAPPGSPLDMLRGFQVPPQTSQSTTSPATLAGLLHLRGGRLDQALAEFDRALIANPNDADALIWRGFGLVLKQRLDNAMADLDKAALIAPRKAEAYLFRGMAFMLRSEPERALTQIDQALKMSTMQPSMVAAAHLLRSEIFLLKKEPDRALESVQISLALAPYTDVYLLRARVYAAKKEHARAIADYDKAISKGPATISMYSLRALSHAALGHKDKAAADYRSALAMPVKSRIDIVMQLLARNELKTLGQPRSPGDCRKDETCL